MSIIYKLFSNECSPDDIEPVSACERFHFPDACSAKTLAKLLCSGGILCVAYDGEQLCGFGYLSVAPFECELLRIAVNDEYRRQGIGREILTRLHRAASEHNCEACFLEVRESNAAARGMYKSLGYEEIGKRRGFYRFPAEDAVLYRMSLTPQHIKTK